MSRKEKKTKKYNKRIIIIRIVLIIIFISATTYSLIYFYNGKDKEQYEDLDKEIIIEDTIKETPKKNSELVEKVIELQQEYADIKGWIRINDTIIDYPLLQGIDNEHYISHNYKKETSKYGSIILDCNSDIKNPNENVIIYGHYMKDKYMFGELLNYKEKAFYDSHPVVTIATDEEETEYQIMYVFLSRVFYQSDTDVFRYYYYYNFENETIYNEYLDNCKALSLYDTGVTAEFGNQLITLITCEYSMENGRLVVVAKKI